MIRLVLTRGVALRIWTGPAILILLWSIAASFDGQLSTLSPVSAAHADNGGSGSGGSGSGKSGSGDSGGHGSGDDGGDGSGGDGSGDDGGGKDGDKTEKAEKAERKSVERFLNRLREKGSVSWAQVREGSVEVRYADGWSESVSAGRYQLLDTRRRVVTDRPAKSGDFKRLAAAAATR